jgi:hypothetical protein
VKSIAKLRPLKILHQINVSLGWFLPIFLNQGWLGIWTIPYYNQTLVYPGVISFFTSLYW